MSFTWIPIYKEIAQKVMELENRQDELLGLLRQLKSDGLKVISLTDKDIEGKEVPLTVIDPITFFASFNRSILKSGRQEIIERIKAAWHLTAPVPEDFDGIPTANAQNSWAFAYLANRTPMDIPTLWKAARAGVTHTWRTFDHELFDKAKNIRRSGVARLSIGLFWLNPMGFLPSEHHTRDYFKRRKIEPGEWTADGYFSWIENVVAIAGENFPEISHEAYVAKQPPTKPTLSQRYWLWAPGEGAEHWEEFYEKGIAAIGWNGTSDLRAFATKDDIREELEQRYPGDQAKTNDARTCWQFVHDMQLGDIIFAKKGTTKVLGRGVVTGEYEFDENRTSYKHVRKVKWDLKGEWVLPEGTKLALKTLTDITKNDELVTRISKTMKIGPAPPTHLPYTKSDFLAESFMSAELLDTLLARLKRKKAIIIQGPPGVGKTFIARRLAYTLMGRRDDSRVQVVQFHPSYGYEDFIQGYRPARGGLERRDGVLHRFVRLVRDSNHECVFIIDEINRGNLAKIFGELLMLIESDKRGPQHAIPLTYSDSSEETFYLPENLYFIGTMNTADRSLAMVDYALRRRFAFVTLEPAFTIPGFAGWLKGQEIPDHLAERICSRLEALNRTIRGERDLGHGFQIGHSYFCPQDGEERNNEWYREVIAGEIGPLLAEYFDSPDKVETLVADLLAE